MGNSSSPENRCHPSPDLRVPGLLAAVTGRGAAGSQSKQAPKIRPGPSARGVLLMIRERGGRRSQFRTLPPPGPGPLPASARAENGCGLFRPLGRTGRDASPQGVLARLYLLFHVPQQFLFDCVLRAAHGAAAG